MEKKLNPENVRDMLKNKGVEVSLEQAKGILDFLRKLAEAVVSRYLRKNGKKPENELNINH